MGKTEKVILGIILFVGAALRVYNFWDFSLSNDELSALARLNFNSLRDLIMEGVRIDGHPPAAQVVLWYMTKWFGNSVFVVRLPFVLAGIASVYFIFRVAKEWVSTSAGLLSSATFATLIFPVLYSRIARPYALGMLFALMAAFFWIRIVKEKHSLADYFLLALSLALCAYSHYFAAFVAAMLAVSGTFLIKGRNLRNYLFALVGAFLLFLPYIPIFLHQLSLGGVGQWLSKPENDWLWEHIRYVFNDSWIVLIIIPIAGISGYFLCKSKKSFLKIGLPLIFFLAPFVVGFAYSKWVNPVLQNSTLLFSFPFLLVFIFAGWNDDRPKITTAASIVLLTVSFSSTVFEKQFFRTNYFGVFKELAVDVIDWNKEVNSNALLIGDFNHPFYINYYLERNEPLKLSLYRTTDEKGLAELKSLVDTSSNEYAIYAWSTINQVPEVEAIIREKFPIEVKRDTYFNSEVVMFRKGVSEFSFSEKLNFEKTDSWNVNPDAVQQDSTGIKYIQMTGENLFGPTFQTSVQPLIDKGVSEIVVRITCSEISETSGIQLVYEQSNGDDRYVWESDPFARQFSSGGPNWGVFSYKLKLPHGDVDMLKIYPWSADGEWVNLYSMEVGFR
ncbi:MAG: hypothetical protein GC178_08185 [Flavobacteriales bacterium]|nr:hypothetical protein [Flavobacteriales bacterium]